jgi:hypothetical protein
MQMSLAASAKALGDTPHIDVSRFYILYLYGRSEDR